MASLCIALPTSITDIGYIADTLFLFATQKQIPARQKKKKLLHFRILAHVPGKTDAFVPFYSIRRNEVKPFFFITKNSKCQEESSCSAFTQGPQGRQKDLVEQLQRIAVR
jgi:hypothetical protein